MTAHKPRPARKGPPEQYRPAKIDSRVGEARSLLMMRDNLATVMISSIAAQFNLRLATVKYLIAEETRRRG